MDISDALHALGLNVAHCLLFFPQIMQWHLSHVPITWNLSLTSEQMLDFQSPGIHVSSLHFLLLCLQLIILDTAQSIYMLCKHSLFQMPCGIIFFGVFMEDCQMREAAELGRHRKEWKINPLMSTRKQLSVLVIISLITILLNLFTDLE